MMTPYLSKKLKWHSILMTILVVFIHAFNFDYLIDGSNPIIHHIYFAPSVDLGRSAVPLFFLISGLLFFKGCTNFTLQMYKDKIRKRTKTILIPYLILSALFMFLVWFTHLSFVPYFLQIDNLLPSYSLQNILTAWILKPQAYYLWFLRNLFALALFSPLIYWVLKKLGWFFIIPAMVAWIAMPYTLPGATLSIVFFMLGAFISIKPVALPQSVKVSYVLLSIALWIGFIVLSKVKFNMTDTMIMASFSIYSVLGIVVAWFVYDYINPQFVERAIRSTLARYIFPVYLFHQIFLALITQIWLHLAQSNSIGVVLPMYYTSIVLSIILSIFVAMALQKFAPPFYRLITGSR